MRKKIKDLTIEELARFYELDGITCDDCPLNKMACGGICEEAHDVYVDLKDKNEEVDV